MSAKALREERAGLVAAARKLQDTAAAENRDLAPEENARFTQLMGGTGPDGKPVVGEVDRLKERIDRLERLDSVERDLARPIASPGSAGGPPVDADYHGQDYQRFLTKQGRKAEKEHKRKEWIAQERQRFFGRDDRGKRKGPTEEHRALLLQAWMRTQERKPLKRQHEWALEACGVSERQIQRDWFDIDLGNRRYADVRRECGVVTKEGRALAVNANVAGGYTVPEGFVNQLEIALLLYSNIRGVADVMRTSSGQDLPWPAVNDTFNKGQILVENAQVSNQDIVFSNMVLHAYKYTSKLVQVPVELLEDSAFDMASTLGQLLGIRVARIQNDHLTFGTGVAQPTGIVTAAATGVTAASSTAIGFDDLYRLKHAVDPAYRVSGMNAGWMFHDQIFGYLKRLKDGAGRYLWQPGVASMAPDTIDGDPYTINQSMVSTIASGNRTVLYGAFIKYKVRDVTQVRLRRLVERYADLDQEGYVMFARMDANLLDAGSHPIQYLVH